MCPQSGALAVGDHASDRENVAMGDHVSLIEITWLLVETCLQFCDIDFLKCLFVYCRWGLEANGATNLSELNCLLQEVCHCHM